MLRDRLAATSPTTPLCALNSYAFARPAGGAARDAEMNTGCTEIMSALGLCHRPHVRPVRLGAEQTAAAQVMNLTQPAITHQIRELENRFQAALFERAGNRICLTIAGRKLAEYARPLIEHEAQARTEMREFLQGWFQHVRIGTSMTLLINVLPAVLRQLKLDHPNLEITLKTGLTSGTLRLLSENQLDLGLCALPLEDSAFDTFPLLDDDLVAIVPGMLPHVPETVTQIFFPACRSSWETRTRPCDTALRNGCCRRARCLNPPWSLTTWRRSRAPFGVGLGSSIVPGLSLSRDRPTPNIAVRPIDPRMTRQTGLVKLRGKHVTDAVSVVYKALLTLRDSKTRDCAG